MAGRSEEGLPVDHCGKCATAEATLRCDICEGKLCAGCWDEIHCLGALLRHIPVALSSPATLFPCSPWGSTDFFHRVQSQAFEVKEVSRYALGSCLAHAGTLSRGDPVTGSINMPLYLGTTFRRADNGSWPHGYSYGRHSNPTRLLFEKTMNEIEGGAHSLSFASGMAVAHAVFFGFLHPGDHVLLSDDVYREIFLLLDSLSAKMGFTYSLFDVNQLEQLDAGLKQYPRCKIVWVEIISNPLLKVANLRQIREIISANGVSPLFVADSTWSPPVMIKPLSFGVDLVLHSCTKYIGGHSDLLGGVVVMNNAAFLTPLRSVQTSSGGMMAPYDCFLALRSLRTLHVRLQRHCENARHIAEFLAQQKPRVKRVLYPGFEGSHQSASEQFSKVQGETLCGGMISFELDGGFAATTLFAAKLQLFTNSTSLGATESLVEPSKKYPGLVRLSIGLEDPLDLIQDLNRAFTQ